MIYIVFLLITLLVLGIAYYNAQFFMMFSPVYCRDEELDDTFEYIYICTQDNIELEGVVYEPENSKLPIPTILYFTGRSQDSVGMIKKLSDTYVDSRIITFNYRSYGKSTGKIDEKNIYSDALQIATLVQKNYGDFYLLGFSLGSIAASFIAQKMKVKGLFLVGSFDTISNVARIKYGFRLPFLRYKFDNVALVKNIDSDTYLFSSRSDEITYIENTMNLKKNIKKLVYYKEFDNITHKELLFHSELVAKINEVIKKDTDG